MSVYNKMRRFWQKQIESRLRPRQRWLTKQIPRTWVDPDYIIETCTFAALIYFWEEDAGEATIRYQYEADYTGEYGTTSAESEKRVAEYKVIYDRLKAAYDWAKVGRLAEEAAHEKMSVGGSAKINAWVAKENYIIDQNTFYLKEIIELRKYMWT